MHYILLYRTISFVFLPCLLMCAPIANAQARDTPVKSVAAIGTEQNPFDFVLQAAEDQGQLKRPSKSFQQNTQSKAIQNKAILGQPVQRKTLALQYRKKFNGTFEQARALRKTLVAKYGEPNSVRGPSHVWDIKNPSRGNGQAEIVTIILKMGEVGGYELIMDRDRGEDGRATWAAPRIEPVSPKKKQQKTVQFKPVLQPDND